MIPIKDVIKMASDAGAEMGKMEELEFAIVMTPEQLYTMCHLVFEMGRSKNVNKMVDRFLGWKLPPDFCPDAGIGFKPYHPYEGDTYGNSWWPIGTNLFTAIQAKAMFEYCLAEELRKP